MAVRQVVAGLGGVGKTQIAVEYAYRYRSRYQAVCWVRAGARSTLVADYAALERHLGLPGVGKPDQRLVLAAVRGWFEANDGWLLIFDDAGAPSEPIGEGPEFETLYDFLPRPLRGHVMVTTRDQTWESAAEVVPVNVLPREDAEAFLLAQTRRPDQEAARQVADALGFLPLALEQARAYIEAVGISLSEYLDRLQAFPELFEKGRPRDYEGTVASTWKVSIEKVRASCPGAADLFEVYAFLFRDDIPRAELFVGGIPGLTPGLETIARTPISFDEAVAELRRYSLVRPPDEGSTVASGLTIHRLVQTVVRLSLTYDDQLSRASIAVRVIERLFPIDVSEAANWELCDRLVSHAVACVGHAHDRRVEPMLAARLFQRVLTYLFVRARYVEAHGHTDLLLRIVSIAHSEVSSDFVRALMITGELHYELGDLHTAEEVLERAVRIAETSAGLDASAWVRLLSSIGLVLVELGELSRAMVFQQRALAVARAADDIDDTLVARTLSNLGVVYYELGQRPDARLCQEQAKGMLAGRPDSSDSHLVARRLAVVLYDLGFFEESLKNLEGAVTYFDAKLGEDHPEVAKTLHHLGFVFWDMGRLSDARKCFEQATTIFGRVFTLPHPAVARTLAGLGMVLMDEGHLEDALAAQRESLALFEQLFGPDHFEVGRTLDKLGFVLRNLQRRVQAREQQERSISILTASLGDDHPELGIPLSNLGLVLQELGELDDARARHDKAIAIFESSYPDDHPHRQLAYSRLAVVLQRIGEVGEARRLLEDAVSVFRMKKGDKHPDVARAMEKLGFVLEDIGDWAAARQRLMSSYDIFFAALGSDHPRTEISRQRLAAFEERRSAI